MSFGVDGRDFEAEGFVGGVVVVGGVFLVMIEKELLSVDDFWVILAHEISR